MKNAFLNVNRELHREYRALEKFLEEAPADVQRDVVRLAQDIRYEIDSARRDGRRDVLIRGRGSL